MVEPEFELKSSDSKSSALCSTPSYLMQRTASAVKDTRRRKLMRPVEVRAGFIEAMKGDGKCTLKAG